MMRRCLLLATALAAVCVPLHAVASEAEGGAFQSAMHHYEAIRKTFLNDSNAGVEASAEALRSTLQELEANLTAASAEVPEGRLHELRQLLAEAAGAARLVARAPTLEEGRKNFHLLSKPLIRWREWSTARERPVVVWCPMARKSWLQPAGEIGNPYHGQEMPRCGTIVSKEGDGEGETEGGRSDD